MSKNELESAVAEKNEVIKELREEGEKLSKQQLQHSNIIKKLRTKEKEHEATIKNLKYVIFPVNKCTVQFSGSLAGTPTKAFHLKRKD